MDVRRRPEEASGRSRGGVRAAARATRATTLVCTLVAAAAALLGVAGRALASDGLGPATFRVLEVDPTGAVSTSAARVSGDGSAVTGQLLIPPTGPADGYRWTQETGFVPVIPAGGGSLAFAHGMSFDGSVVAGQDGATAVRWTAASGAVTLGYLPSPSPWPRSRAWDVSADGALVVGCSDVYDEGNDEIVAESFRWTAAGGMVGLGLLGTQFRHNCATAVSSDGSVIVGYAAAVSVGQPFLWSEATGPVWLGNLGFGGLGSAQDVNADGTVVVGHTSTLVGNEAFRWTSATGMAGLGYLQSTDRESVALAVSADGGTIVGYSETSGLAPRAFVWDAQHGMRDLDSVLVGLGAAPTIPLTAATGISDDGGVIVGVSRADSLPGTRGWIATIPVPEPSLGVLQAVGLLAVAGLRACSRRRPPARQVGPISI